MGVPQVLSIIKKVMAAFARLPPGRCCACRRAMLLRQWTMAVAVAVGSQSARLVATKMTAKFTEFRVCQPGAGEMDPAT